MPLYEYQCDACTNRFERIQKFSDPPVESCPACGGAVRKLLSSPAIQFKGSGWYITDYAKKGPAASGEGKGGKPAGGDTGSSGTTTDTAPAKTASSDAGGSGSTSSGS